ncbi:MAG: TldD/PmbA family protein [Clostridia bacterium]|nr:TldD/PmbA family protein [Clostridia bacterium]
MIDTLLALLKASDIDGWEITDTSTEGWEFYLIRHRLDQNRVRKVRHISVKVYKRLKNGTCLGSASGEMAPTLSEAEMRRQLQDLIKAASLVENRAYTLNPRAVLTGKTPEKTDPAVTSETLLELLSSLPETDSADMNSAEIFVDQVTRRFLTSEGTDVTTCAPKSMLEVVVNARRNGHEIELYRLYRFGACDREMLREDLCRALRFGPDRLTAVPTPALQAFDVVFSTADACPIYRYFIDRMNASMIVRGYSDWKIGQRVCEQGDGDPVTIQAVGVLPGSSVGGLLDPEGALTCDMPVITDSIAAHYHGSRQFRCYAEMTDGYLAQNFVVSGGHRTDDEIRNGDYLEIVEFSDFQVDTITGDIAGEIRLGYLHKGSTVSVVTGGSVSGSMRTLARDMRMSLRQVQYDCLRIPALTRLHGVTITGCENEA